VKAFWVGVEMLKIIGIVVGGAILFFGGWVFLQIVNSGGMSELSVLVKPTLRVEKAVQEAKTYSLQERLALAQLGIKAEDVYQKEAIKITNVGRSKSEIKKVIFNKGEHACEGGDVRVSLVVGTDTSVQYNCGGTIVRVEIFTDHGTAEYEWK
jgi:hypothetical protein